MATVMATVMTLLELPNNLCCLQSHQQWCAEFHAEQTPLRKVNGPSRGAQPQLCAPKCQLVIRTCTSARHPRRPLNPGRQPWGGRTTKKKTTASPACAVILSQTCFPMMGNNVIRLSHQNGVAGLGEQSTFVVLTGNTAACVGVWYKEGCRSACHVAVWAVLRATELE